MIRAARAAWRRRRPSPKRKSERLVLDLELDRLRFQLAKVRREAFGSLSEPGSKLEQIELALEDIEETLAAMEAGAAAEADTAVGAFTRRKPARRPLPEHLPRIRQVYPGPSACPCCAGRLHKLGEDVTETLERVPASWVVIQHVREKFSLRSSPRAGSADPARPSPSRPRHPTRSRVAAPGRCCWPRSPRPSSACICRCIGRAGPLLAKASRSTCRPWLIGWARSVLP